MAVAVRRLLVVLAMAGAGLAPVPAVAAGYCAGSGVSVVVDFGGLGGGIQKGCDSSGNHNAAKAFTNTGHPLTYAQRQPGFVCRVNGVPQSDPCVNTSPADAYWGLFWSDGSGWKYSSLGVGSLTVPAGATVAFSWQNGGTLDPPGAAPAAPAPASHSPSPTPTRHPTKQPTKRPVAGATSTAAASASTSADASAAASTSASGSATPSASATTSPSAEASSSGPAAVGEPTPLDPTTADSGGGGLAWWVPVLVLLALAGGGGAVWWTRRTGTS